MTGQASPSAGPRIVASGCEGLADLVEASRRAFLFCLDEQGRPIGYAMNVMQCARGALWFTSYTKAAKVRHLASNGHACVAVIDEQSASVRWCVAEGEAVVRRATPADLEFLFGGFRD